MQSTLAKTKLTLWVPIEAKMMSKQLAKEYRTSISQMFLDYLLRFKKTQGSSFNPGPIVKRLSGIIKNKRLSGQDYRKHLEKKYLNA